MHQERDSTDRHFTDIKYRLKKMDSKSSEESARRDAELEAIRSDQQLLRDRFNRMEGKLDTLLTLLKDILEGNTAVAD